MTDVAALFDAFVRRATSSHEPYDYQRRLAVEGLPDVLRAPTGAGKTLAAVLPWLFRRRHHPHASVRAATPGRLVVVLPQRALVEQTAEKVARWLDRLGEHDVGRYVLMGGIDGQDRAWKTLPHQDAVFVGTQDMVLSRLLMRGYAEPRAQWPMSYGLLHAGTQFVFDEVQLMGPALQTSLQLEGLRELLGTAAACRSMWMSATLDPERLRGLAPDLRRGLAVVELSGSDRTGALRSRLDATRRLRRIAVDPKRYARDLAAHVLAEHRPGTRTLVVLNRVERAVDVYEAVQKARPEALVVLLHSRFRPPDRAARSAAVTAEPGPAGTIVVSTQVLEAGVDITSELLVTELAPWSSVVQRAGRCNRDGLASDARMHWASPPAGRDAHLPYDADRLVHAEGILTRLEGEALTSTRLQDAADDLPPPLYPQLRRRDLVDLFDTAPDLDGNDVDVTQWIRDADERTVMLAWRDTAAMTERSPFPERDELCPAPLGAARELVRDREARVYEQRTGRWLRPVGADVRPGGVVVLDAARGGYLSDRGFAPRATIPVAVVGAGDVVVEASQTDPLSLVDGPWLGLTEHLADVERDAARLLDALDPPGITAAQRGAARLASRYHDLGKAHPTFQTSLQKVSGDPGAGGPWAKSPGSGPLRHDPPHFRHELVSALLTLDPSTGLLDDVDEPDLVAYLVLAHHGKVRLSVRGRPEEPPGRTLGVTEGDLTLPILLPDGRELGPVALSLAATRMGRGGLTTRALRLRDRADLGPFRLAYLEAVVRAADWVASARHDGAGR